MPPPKQDKATKYGHVNAGDFSSWVMIYPVYLNQTKTLAEGRRISKEKAVIDPTLEDLQEACNLLRLKFIVEPYKQYPREWTPSGRIRVEIKNPETGSKIHRDISSRKDLYEKIAIKIPLLHSRKNRLEKEKLRLQKQKRLEEEQAKTKSTDADSSKTKAKIKGKKDK